MKGKNRYIIDEKNRLIVKNKGRDLLANGRFSIDRNNQLIYWLNEPAGWRREHNFPTKISFIGNWQLTPNYDLKLNLKQTKEQHKGDSLVLKGEIISTDSDTLAFQIKSQDKQGLSHIQLLKLAGCWQADEFNRINFAVDKKSAPDILEFEGSWQINQNQQIIYRYDKTDLKTKTKTSCALIFEGFWQVNSANRLVYILTHSARSHFDFRVQIESPNIYPQEGVIKYRIGMGLRKTRLYKSRVICLYGAWKFSRKAGLTFQLDYGEGKFKDIEFGANVYLNKKDEVALSLTNKNKEPVGFAIVFTHRFLKQRDAEIFLRLKHLQKERGVEAGLRLPF